MSQKPPMKPDILDRYENEDVIEGTSEKARYRIAKLKYEQELAAWNSQRNYGKKILEGDINYRERQREDREKRS